MNASKQLSQALWRIYRRPQRPQPWRDGGNLPWNEPKFSKRMLREHLDESHGAASRVAAERELQIEWLWQKLNLSSGSRLLDFTCGPGLYAAEFAQRGCIVTGVDFSPAAVAYARNLALTKGVEANCRFIETDVRCFNEELPPQDAALFLYGQLAVFEKGEAQALLEKIGRYLKPGGRLVIELLDQERVDKTNSSWWFTDDTGLWGDSPFLHLGERQWNAAEELSIERFHILNLETGQLDQITLCDQTYPAEGMTRMLRKADFGQVEVLGSWAGLPLYDAAEWNVFVAQTRRV